MQYTVQIPEKLCDPLQSVSNLNNMFTDLWSFKALRSKFHEWYKKATFLLYIIFITSFARINFIFFFFKNEKVLSGQNSIEYGGAKNALH